MTFSQFIEYLLWRLYVQERASGSGQFYDLNELAQDLLIPVDQQWVLDAGKVLESRGLARCIFALGGYASGMLTGEGRLYVEERFNLGDSFIATLVEHPEDYVHWAPVDDQDGDAEFADALAIEPPPDAPIAIEQQRAPALSVLQELGTRINDAPLSDEEKHDLLADVETIRAQLGKREPNLAVIAGLLDPIGSRWPFLGAQVSRLSSLLFA